MQEENGHSLTGTAVLIMGPMRCEAVNASFAYDRAYRSFICLKEIMIFAGMCVMSWYMAFFERRSLDWLIMGHRVWRYGYVPLMVFPASIRR